MKWRDFYLRQTLIAIKVFTNFKLLDEVLVIPFEINLSKKWLYFSIYKPTSENIQYFLRNLSDLFVFYSNINDDKVVPSDFNLEPANPTLLNFPSSQNFINLIKGSSCSKGKGSCMKLTLTNRKYSFQNTHS